MSQNGGIFGTIQDLIFGPTPKASSFLPKAGGQQAIDFDEYGFANTYGNQPEDYLKLFQDFDKLPAEAQRNLNALALTLGSGVTANRRQQEAIGQGQGILRGAIDRFEGIDYTPQFEALLRTPVLSDQDVNILVSQGRNRLAEQAGNIQRGTASEFAQRGISDSGLSSALQTIQQQGAASSLAELEGNAKLTQSSENRRGQEAALGALAGYQQQRQAGLAGLEGALASTYLGQQFNPLDAQALIAPTTAIQLGYEQQAQALAEAAAARREQSFNNLLGLVLPPFLSHFAKQPPQPEQPNFFESIFQGGASSAVGGFGYAAGTGSLVGLPGFGR